MVICIYMYLVDVPTYYDKSNTKTCWKLRLTTRMDWKIERIIWIGYMKNQDTKFKNDKNIIINTNVCHLAKLSKDVVKNYY